MNINIKPTIIEARDYHDFYAVEYAFEDFGIKINFEENNYIPDFGSFYYYKAIFWLDGDEEELFKFLMTDERMIAATEAELEEGRDES